MPTGLRLATFVSTLVMVLALSAALSLSVASAAWSIQNTSPPPKESATYLYDVSCEPSSTELCTAVGRSNKSGVDSPLALRRSGTSWSEQTAAKKSGATHTRLFGVDCPSETRCLAVGNHQSAGGPSVLSEIWNEGKWNVQTTPLPTESTSSEFAAIGCSSTAQCSAVGSAMIGGVKTAIAERWTSPNWALSSIPIPAGATSSQLDGVDCIWSNFCAAVGRYTTSGGSVKSLVMFWNGEWKLHTVTDPEGAVESTLLDVACTPTPNRCTAVGGWKNNKGEQFTLAYRFNGVTTWTLQSTPNPSGSTESLFQDVSCASETSCTAVGSWVSSGGGSNRTLAEGWNGSSWLLDSTPNPPGEAFNSLFGVSCRSISCLGVGWSLNAENPAMALVSPAANTFRFVHDADGRLKAVIEPEGEAAYYGWDASGNLTSISRRSSSKLSIIQLSPAQGAVGDTVKIKGTGFSSTPGSNTVKFNGTAATVEAATPWSLTVKVPVGATTGAVTVATGAEPVASPENFTVATSAKPSISSISPTIAASGEEVTISGSNFEPATYDNVLMFNGVKPEPISASTTSLKIKVPAERLGGAVSVATFEGSAIGPDLFVPPNGLAVSKVGTTARMSLGESKTVSLVGSEKRALILFDGNAGENVSLVASESALSGTISIWGPSGSQLTSGGFSGLVGPVTLPVTGTYTIMLTPSGAASGSVKVASHKFEDPTATLDPPATAEGLKQPVSLTVPGQNARYSVEMKAGDKVSLRTSSTTFTESYYLRWYNPSGSLVHEVGISAKQDYFWDPRTFSVAGTWTLVVDPYGTGTGTTDLFLWETPDITGQSITPSTEGGSVTSTIDIPGQRELISFSGTAGQKVSWKTSESTISAGGAISILKPDGSELSGSNGTFSFHDPVTLPTTGTYKFVIDPATTGSTPVTNGTGSVKLTAYTFEDPTATLDPPATAEGLKQPVSLTVPGQNARYSVEMKAGDKVSLRTNNSNMTGQYRTKWINPSGQEVYSIYYGAKENYFWDSKTLSTAGTWTLVVDPEGETTGSVDLVVWETPDITGQSITPSTEGGSVTSTIDIPGQRELISFSGTASQLITLKAQESTITSGAMSILKPDGNLLSGSEVTFSSSSSGKKEVTLPSTGTYTVVVDPPTTITNPVTNGTGSVKVIVYLGSHASWQGAASSEPQLVRFSSDDWSAGAYSDIPVGRLMPSVSRPRDAEPRRKKSESDRLHISHRVEVAMPVPRKRLGHKKSSTSPFPRDWRPDQRAAWLPPEPNQDRNWLVGPSSSPWLELPALGAASGTTALAGQILRVDGLPLAGLSVSIEGTDIEAETGHAGRFLLEDLPAGHQVLQVHGEDGRGRRFGTYEIGVDLAAGKTTPLDYTIWLTPLDDAGDLRVDSPTKGEASLKTPRVPGLEVKIPAGTTINDNGRAVKSLNITAIPLDRPPFPLPPFVTVPVYFTVQPGGASLSKGARFIYPNWGELAPGERVDFWNYDPEDRGWYVYGRGTVTSDGKQVVPDPGVRVWSFTGAMAVSGPTPPSEEPKPKPKKGDPVDLYTGLFTYDHTDLVLPDTIPISINRTYRTKDSNSYSFGEGTTNAYDLRLWPIVNYKEADLILPDGDRVHYVRTSPGTGYEDAIYEPTGEAGSFDGSTITFTEGSNWALKLRSGMTLTFGGFAPLIRITDRFGNVLTIKRTGGVISNIKEIISPNGRWARFTYDSSNRITEIIDNGGRKTKYTYTSGRLTKVEAPGGRTTQYEYDTSGRMKAVINPRGNKFLQIEYDANGRVKKQTAGDGGTFDFAYELGEAGKVKATTTTDPLGNQHKVTFNAEGHWTSETEAPGTELAQTTNFERQAGTGLILSETDPLGRKTAYEYDSNGNVKEVTQMAGTGEAETTKFVYEPGTDWIKEEIDPLGHTTKYQYGVKGQLLKRTDALGHETTFEYNGEGQLVSLKDPEGSETKFTYEGGDLIGVTNPLGNTTSQFVDALGRVRSTTLPGGERYLYTYNEAGQPTSETSPLGAKTTIEYDADGNPTAIIDPRSGKTTMAYDSMDRVTKEADALEKSMEWTYNKAGDLVEAVDRRGKVSKLSYDKLRRLTGVSFGVSGETSESSIGYEYDAANRLTEVNDSTGGEYTLGYDSFDRLTDVEGPNGTIGYEFDAAGRRTLMEVPGGTVEYEYDDANRLSELASGAQAVSFAYDKAHRLESLTLPNGIEQVYGYDKASQATSITYKDGETTLGAINYAYDANGRTEAMWGSYARLGLPEPLKSTKYNAANQLTEREGKALTYDADGNLTKDGSNEYTWNARGQLTKISGANTASFGYDPFGRRSSKTLGGTTTKLLYDGANVVQESVGESVTADVLTGLAPDQLFSRTTEAGTSSYLTDRLGSAIALANGSGEVKTSYTYDPFGSMSKTGEATSNPYQFTGRENDGTGLVYYRARYYSPLMGRFISQDPAGFLDGANLYEYVDGAPLDFTDPTGEMAAQSAVCCRNAWDKVVKARDKVAEWRKILDDVGKNNKLDDLDEWIEEKIGDWAGCGDEVSSGEDGWKDILKGAGKGGAGGVLRKGPGGFLPGAAKGAAKEGGKQRLKRFVCDRLG
ncbi:MAG TPA: RHS repeat-associated core domain-containing protein [Solirubrobacterales bacterium]